MPDDPKNPDSLGDDHTFTGERDVPQEEQRSLGDQATAGDALSSISDLELDGQAVDSDLPLIDLARFEIEGELGKGGMGAVQLATDRQLKRKVAIKRIHAISKSALARFVTEAQSIAALNHFNIVQVHDFGRDTDGPLLIMEYVSGGSLLDRLKQLGFKTPGHTWFCRTVEDILDAIVKLDRVRGSFDYDTDGAVIKLQSLEQRRRLGATAKAPNWFEIVDVGAGIVQEIGNGSISAEEGMKTMQARVLEICETCLLLDE